MRAVDNRDLSSPYLGNIGPCKLFKSSWKGSLKKKLDSTKFKSASSTQKNFHLSLVCGISVLGKDGVSKTDEFLEKFQTAFDHPPHFRKIMLRFFPEYMTEEAFIMAKICNINFWIGNDPPPPFWNFSKNSSVLEMPPFPYGANKTGDW